MSWQDKLTAKERAHIAETTSNNSLWSFKANRRFHHKMKAKTGEDPCHECRHIAIKLGIEKGG